MHIYCDESGGVEPGSPCFLVAAVAVEPIVADRFVKQFRRRSRLAGEVHGHELDAKQRDRFLRLLQSLNGVRAVAVVLVGRGSAAGVLRRRVPEPVLRAHMMAQAVALVRATPELSGPKVGITIDGGRYKNAVLDRERVRLVETLSLAEPAIAFEA